MQGAAREFDHISKQLRTELEKNEFLDNGEYNEAWFATFQSQLYETCIGVLEKLKSEDFFKNIVGKDIFLMFTVSEYEFETKDLKKIIKRLNNNTYKTEYLEWMKTWDSVRLIAKIGLNQAYIYRNIEKNLMDVYASEVF